MVVYTEGGQLQLLPGLEVVLLPVLRRRLPSPEKLRQLAGWDSGFLASLPAVYA